MKKFFLNFLLWSLVVFHFWMFFLNVAAIFVLPFLTPWYISAPLMTYLVNLMGDGRECMLTKGENKLRLGLGYKPIGGFVGSYIIKPIKILFKVKRK